MCVSKFGLSITIILLLIGCSHSVYEQPSDKYPFKSQMVKLLGSDIEIIDSINKHEAQISYFEFIKDPNKIDKISVVDY